MHAEREVRTVSGWPLLVLNILLYALGVYLLVQGIRAESVLVAVAGGCGVLLLSFLVSGGFYVVNPNEAAVLLLFGDYRGTAKHNGFWWTNPFIRRIKVSLRARTLNGQKIKVNDRTGNPIEIAVVVVWQVRNTSMAQFDVDNYVDYVNTQSETALRHLASAYPYDAGEDELSLRGATDEINVHLKKELQERLDRAGVVVIESRLSHLAYAPEIAGSMLQRQQATAVIAARKKIVEGAVGMVDDALRQLSEGHIVELDEERKAAMVSNLLVVLCSERSTQPVVNAGRSIDAGTGSVMAQKKAFPLRLDPDLYEALRRWAEGELRSVNGQIEFLLREAVESRGKGLKKAKGKGPAGPTT